MPTINTSIGYPVITAPAHFQVRYRADVSVGSPPWTNLPDQTNAPFSFSVPAFGSWILGITYVDSAGDSCEESLYPFESVQVCDCITITGAIVQRDVPGGPVYINLPYSNPASVNPGCGILVQYIPDYLPPDLSTPATLRLSPMPTSPIKIPVPSLIPYRVEVILDCCDGRVQSCFSDTLPANPDPAVGCVQVDDVNTITRIVKSASTGTYYLEVTFPGPPVGFVPAQCPQMNFTANQINLVSSGRRDSVTGTLPPSAFYPYPATGWQTRYALNPNSKVDYLGIRYIVVIHDCCGNAFTFPNVLYEGGQIP